MQAMDTKHVEEQKIKLDNNIWKKYAIHLSSFRGTFFQIMGYMLLAALIDMSFPAVASYTIDHVIAKGNMNGLIYIAVSFLILASLLAGTVYQFVKKAGKLEADLCYTLRKDQFEKIQRLSMSYFDKNALGWIISKIGSDTTRISEVLAWGFVDVAWSVFTVLILSIIMLAVNWKLALIIIGLLPVLVLMTAYLSKKILAAQRVVRRLNSKIIGQFNDGIVGAKTSKTLLRETLNIEEFKETTERMRKKSVFSAVVSSTYMPSAIIISTIGTALTLLLGGNSVMGGRLTFGTLVLFISYSRMFYEPIFDLTRVYADLVRAQAAGERVMALIEEREEIQDSPQVVETYGDIFDQKRSHWVPIQGNIEFKDVSFGYKQNEMILEHFNLEVPAGSTVAIVGRTGAGKSTIVNLVCRFYEPQQGEILIDGVDYRERSQSWLHSNLGYVLQSPHLFSGSIRDNIRYGKLDATDKEIVEAAKLVNAHSFIVKLRDGYDTEVGEGGALLSTGEKQLISFARAIIARPAFFILDEATSSIDTETEAMIQKAVDILLKDRTSFVIAHRLSTIRNADIILVLEDGKVIERGNHNTLMQEKGHYYYLYTNQFKEEEVKEILNH